MLHVKVSFCDTLHNCDDEPSAAEGQLQSTNPRADTDEETGIVLVVSPGRHTNLHTLEGKLRTSVDDVFVLTTRNQ